MYYQMTLSVENINRNEEDEGDNKKVKKNDYECNKNKKERHNNASNQSNSISLNNSSMEPALFLWQISDYSTEGGQNESS